VSVAHACRAFRRATGATIHARVREARLRHALALLLDTDRPIADIAIDVGFANQGHLGNAFAARFGVSPGRARRCQLSGFSDHFCHRIRLESR
jgi:AraC family transcriptional regulator